MWLYFTLLFNIWKGLWCVFQVVVVLQQVFALIQKVLSKWLNDSQVVEVRCQMKAFCSLKSFYYLYVFQSLYNLFLFLLWWCLQAVCAIFEKSVKTLLHEFGPMVSQLSEMLGQMYSTIPQASALDLTRQVNIHTVHIKMGLCQKPLSKLTDPELIIINCNLFFSLFFACFCDSFFELYWPNVL